MRVGARMQGARHALRYGPPAIAVCTHARQRAPQPSQVVNVCNVVANELQPAAVAIAAHV